MTTALSEWLSPASVTYVVNCLQACESAEMVADLRGFIPVEVLREATKRLSSVKRQQIKTWVEYLNKLGQEVAA